MPSASISAALEEAAAEVGWAPLEGTSQVLAMSCPAQQILYEGTRGCGKTEVQIARFARNVGKGYGSFWTGIIFDRDYKSLGDLITKSKRMFNKIWTEDECWFLASNSQLKWVWATGEELLFRVIDDPEDYWKYHGQEYAYLGWNELTQWPTADCYDIMQSCNRTSFKPEIDSPKDRAGKITVLLDPITLENFATTNSYGIGHFWVKDRFIANARSGEIVVTNVEIEEPGTGDHINVELTRCAIRGTWKENYKLDAVYIAKLKTERDPVKLKSWYFGSWDIPAGGAFDDLWRKDVHVVPRFKVPKEWRVIDRSYDDGGTHPFSVGWWVEANGETIKLPNPVAIGEAYGANGFYDWTPEAGSLIQIAEWYGKSGKYGDNRGLGTATIEIAKGINERELAMLTGGWIDKLPSAGPADNRIFNTDPDKESPNVTFEKQGVIWERCDKTAGSRERDFKTFRDRLWAGISKEGPAIYFCANCEGSIVTIPSLPRAKKQGVALDDVETKAEDHPYDMTRYRVQKGNLNWVTGLNMQFPM
jgi:hypothetical protein